MNITTQKKFVGAEAILRFLITEDKELDTLFILNQDSESFFTTDQALYEAISSLLPYDNANIKKLGKLLETVQVISHSNATGTERQILTHEKMEKIRTEALKSR